MAKSYGANAIYVSWCMVNSHAEDIAVKERISRQTELADGRWDGSEAVAAGVVSSFTATVEMKLDQYIAHVVLHGVFTDHQPLRDRLIGSAIRQFAEHLDLA